MDWLEIHNPNIDWVAKMLKIQSATGTVLLKGHKSSNVKCVAISASELTTICRTGAASHYIHVYAINGEVHTDEVVPEQVQNLLSQFSAVFAEPQELPPRRSCDHPIPLMQGAQPVNARAYRHKPELKSKIDRQVQDFFSPYLV